jgi:hypothetical protein
MTDQDFFEQLAKPFPVDRVSWRIGATNGEKTKGMALAYIDARDVMDRLDEVCGPAGWQDRYPHANGRTVCDIGIKVAGEWIWKADGAGDTDVEAEKGALSDAFKRAAVRWGIGRYLYTVDSPWVEIEARGRSHLIKDGQQAALHAALRKAMDLQEWGTAAERATLRSLCNVAKKYLKTPTDVTTFRQENEGEMALLRVKAREHLQALLGRIADGTEGDFRPAGQTGGQRGADVSGDAGQVAHA